MKQIIPLLGVLCALAIFTLYRQSISLQIQQLYQLNNNSHDRNHSDVAPQQLAIIRDSISLSSFLLPIVPSLNETSKNNVNRIAAIKAMDDVFRYASTTTRGIIGDGSDGGGWIDVNALAYEDIMTLRHLGATIMSRNISCGRPTVLGESISSGLEYCFWNNDLVSFLALQKNFGFEPRLWGWVLQQFRDLDQELAKYQLNDNNTATNTTDDDCHHHHHLGFLDIGVNVGDWASPLRIAMPTHTPYFGIEGAPSTSAIAIANMRTSIEHHLRAGRLVGPTALLPFALVSKGMLEQVREAGGVCFRQELTNVGGQGVDSVLGQGGQTTECSPSQTAGGTLLSHALQSLVPLQQQSSSSSSSSSCPGRRKQNDWPRIYVAKIDVEGFEFKALTSAIDWLVERPPCYLMIEFHPMPQTYGIIELLLDIGYGSLWQGRRRRFPPALPFWSSSSSRQSNQSLHSLVQADMAEIKNIGDYKDYIFGFENQEKCLRRLLAS